MLFLPLSTLFYSMLLEYEILDYPINLNFICTLEMKNLAHVSNKIAFQMDFSAKFKKTVDRTCVTKILQKIDQLFAYSKADPEIESKRIKQMTTITKVGVAPLTFVLV